MRKPQASHSFTCLENSNHQSLKTSRRGKHLTVMKQTSQQVTEQHVSWEDIEERGPPFRDEFRLVVCLEGRGFLPMDLCLRRSFKCFALLKVLCFVTFESMDKAQTRQPCLCRLPINEKITANGTKVLLNIFVLQKFVSRFHCGSRTFDPENCHKDGVVQPLKGLILVLKNFDHFQTVLPPTRCGQHDISNSTNIGVFLEVFRSIMAHQTIIKPTKHPTLVVLGDFLTFCSDPSNPGLFGVPEDIAIQLINSFTQGRSRMVMW